MKQQIRYRGLTLNTDEQAAQPGELALCGNTELHDGALRPSFLSGTDVAAGADFPGTLLYIHKTASYTHYIGYGNHNSNDNWLFYAVPNYNQGVWTWTQYWFSGTNIPTNQGLKSINSIGNTLVVLDTNGTHYFLWKEIPNDGYDYKYLGQKPPFPQLQFRLTMDSTSTWQDHVETSEAIFDEYDNVKDSLRSTVTEQVMAAINKRISDITDDGCFYAPFLIRYCYRMFDVSGSMAWHSAPVLMYAFLQHPIFNELGTRDGNNTYFVTFFQKTKLQWRCLNTMTALDDWADIVSSVDIFITPQFSRIKTSELIEKRVTSDNYDDNEGFVSYYDGLNLVYEGEKYFIDGKTSSGRKYFSLIVPNLTSSSNSFKLPELDDEAYYEKIKTASEFFRLASINAQSSNFTNTFADVVFSADVLKNIAVQERMKDDYHSHYTIVADNSFVYNSRLHLYGIKENVRAVQPFSLLFPSCDQSQLSNDLATVSKAKVTLKTDEGTKEAVLDTESTQKISLYNLQRGWVFFSDSRASSIEIVAGGSHYIFYLEPSDLLEGAVSFRNGTLYSSSWSDPSNATVPYPNKIYVSEVSNPYFFPLSGRQTVGIGSIIGLTANTRALSEGQFGQFPLMVFCSDGIWTLEVNNEGKYSSADSVSREVCVNPASICQLDQSVLFASKKGLSRIVGSDVALVSEVLNGPVVNCGTLLGLNTVFGSGGTFQNSDVYKLMQATGSPLSFITSGQLLYDFANERVLVLPSSPTANSSNVVYVLSLRDGTWSTMLIPGLVKAINGYPHPYMQVWKRVESNVNYYKITCLDKPYDYTSNSIYSGIIVTRTLNFETAMKALQGFEQLHTIKPAGTGETKPQPVLWLYGSNDNITWKEIGHSDRLHYPYLAAHTYRFYRMALYLNMKPSERYHATVIDVIEKYNKL